MQLQILPMPEQMRWLQILSMNQVGLSLPATSVAHAASIMQDFKNILLTQIEK